MVFWTFFVLIPCSDAECPSAPISIPIQDVRLSDEKLHRGIKGLVGTPAQGLVFGISAYTYQAWDISLFQRADNWKDFERYLRL